MLLYEPVHLAWPRILLPVELQKNYLLNLSNSERRTVASG